jgi:hypothetical protein
MSVCHRGTLSSLSLPLIYLSLWDRVVTVGKE